MESNSVPASSAGNIKCPHAYPRWIDAMVFDEEGKGIVNRYWTCPDCGAKGRA